MKRNQASVEKIKRLLERAAKKHNESADAACSVAECFERSDCDLSDETFDAVFEAVTELARVSLERKPNYERAARALISRSERIRQHSGSAKTNFPRRTHGQN